MQVQVSKESTLPFILSLVKRKQYLEALDRYKAYLTHHPDHLALLLIDLYKTLYQDPNDINIRLSLIHI